MRVKDLDDSTRLLCYRAQVYCWQPTKANLKLMREAADGFRRAHAEEMLDNVLRGIYALEEGEDAS